MAVHAHPDDEASGGGILAAYADQGVRVVVVTSTNGEFGDAPGGIKPGQDGHNPATVARQRLAELAESARLLPDARINELTQWIRANMCSEMGSEGAKWNNTRVIIFTEYDDTKRYIDAAGLSEADAAKVFAGNARRVYPRLDKTVRERGL